MWKDGENIQSRDANRSCYGGELAGDLTSKKSSKHHKRSLPVPKTDTGREVENTKGREITLSKELGKMTP